MSIMPRSKGLSHRSRRRARPSQPAGLHWHPHPPRRRQSRRAACLHVLCRARQPLDPDAEPAFHPLTKAFSKKFRNHVQALALYSAFYNFVRIDKTLKVTAAMAIEPQSSSAGGARLTRRRGTPRSKLGWRSWRGPSREACGGASPARSRRSRLLPSQTRSGLSTSSSGPGWAPAECPLSTNCGRSRTCRPRATSSLRCAYMSGTRGCVKRYKPRLPSRVLGARSGARRAHGKSSSCLIG